MSLDEFYNSMDIGKSQPVAASKKQWHDRNYIQAHLPPELKAKLDALMELYKYKNRGLKTWLVVAGVRWALDRAELEGGIAWLFDEPKKEDV